MMTPFQLECNFGLFFDISSSVVSFSGKRIMLVLIIHRKVLMSYPVLPDKHWFGRFRFEDRQVRC
jgi:hypothetical protein